MFDTFSSDTFVLRRAFLVGVCRRADINRAFGTDLSPNRASAIMKNAVQKHRAFLYAVSHRGIFPKDQVARPEEADPARILTLIAQGASPQVTGLFADDGISMLLPTVAPAMAMDRGATEAVLHAALNHLPLQVLYVGLRRGESARWRAIWPRAMEFTGAQWQIHAQDLDDREHGFPIKTFLLPRIREARPVAEKAVPAGFHVKTLPKTQRSLRVHFSDQLTPDQESALRNEFRVENGVVHLPAHAVYAFLQSYTNHSINPEIVWPPITRADEIR